MRRPFRQLIWRFRRQQREEDLAEELRLHLEAEAEELRASGVADAEAARAASRELGNVALVKENVRDAWGWTAAEQLLQDVRFGLRSLRKNPGFTAVAVLTLAVGIGLNSAVFTIANGVLFRGFPMVAENDRLLYLSSGPGCCVSYPDFEDWRSQAKSFSSMAMLRGVRRIVTGGNGYAEMYTMTEVSPETFAMVGQKPLLGRDFRPEDAQPGAAPVAILTHDLWERRFDGDPAIIGKTVRMNGVTTTLVGVMPKGFSFPQKQALWAPLIPTAELRERENRGIWMAVGKLAPEATLQSARAEMETIGRRLGNAYPLTNQGRNLIPHVETFNGFFVGTNESTVYWSMWGAVSLVLLIACSNLANLMLARALGRSREISIRVALGAGRWRILRQLSVESLLLSGAGGLLGWVMAVWGVALWAHLERGPGAWSWRIIDYSVDTRVRLYITAITVVTALLFGLAPALRLVKTSVNAGLKDGGRGTAGQRGRLPALLIAGETALALVLLTSAGVMIRSFLNVYTAETGVDTRNVLNLYADLPPDRYPQPEAWVRFFERVRAEMAATPGVETVALATELPTDRTSSFAYEFPETRVEDERLRPQVSGLVVSADYFHAMRAEVLSGRDFNENDTGSSPPVAIVNETFGRRHWPGENAVGKRLRLFDGRAPDVWRTVVGVVPAIAQNGAVHTEFTPLVYRPFPQKPSASMRVMMRIATQPASVANLFRRKMQALDPDLPVVGPQLLDDILAGSYWNRELYSVLFSIFAGIALLLASVGLYAVTTHSVNRRVQEIGVRMAVGASRRDILALVAREGMMPSLAGLVVGAAGAVAVTPLLKSVLVQVSPMDPVSFGLAAMVLVVAALVGCLAPARRATRVDPLVALRHD